MTTQWHKDRIKLFDPYDRLVWPTFSARIKAFASGFDERRNYSAVCPIQQTDARQEEVAKTLIADICANERRLKQ